MQKVYLPKDLIGHDGNYIGFDLLVRYVCKPGRITFKRKKRQKGGGKGRSAHPILTKASRDIMLKNWMTTYPEQAPFIPQPDYGYRQIDYKKPSLHKLPIPVVNDAAKADR